jgi:hypothetical protein
VSVGSTPPAAIVGVDVGEVPDALKVAVESGADVAVALAGVSGATTAIDCAATTDVACPANNTSRPALRMSQIAP